MEKYNLSVKEKFIVGFWCALFILLIVFLVVSVVIMCCTECALYSEITEMYITTKGCCIVVNDYRYNALKKRYINERYTIYVTDEQFSLFSVGDKVIYRDGGILLMEGGSFVQP